MQCYFATTKSPLTSPLFQTPFCSYSTCRGQKDHRSSKILFTTIVYSLTSRAGKHRLSYHVPQWIILSKNSTSSNGTYLSGMKTLPKNQDFLLTWYKKLHLFMVPTAPIPKYNTGCACPYQQRLRPGWRWSHTLKPRELWHCLNTAPTQANSFLNS